MQRLLLLCIATICVCGTSLAWGTRAHAVTAQIAENHLTPKAKKMLDKYLHGHSIVEYASWADEVKKELILELDFKPSNCSRRVKYPHTFEANADCSVFDGDRRGDEWVKNCVYMADGYARELMADHKRMSDTVRFQNIALLVHWLGDMHCPVHIRYPDNRNTGGYFIMMNNQEIWYHRLWDGLLFNWAHPLSAGNAVEHIDTCTPKEISKIQKGNIYDWGKDSATASRAIHKYQEGATVDRREYVEEFTELLNSQIRNGGYRMAKLLNDIFK